MNQTMGLGAASSNDSPRGYMSGGSNTYGLRVNELETVLSDVAKPKK
jgi:hypothetical protein